MSAGSHTTYTSSTGTIEVDELTKQVLGVANRLLTLPKFGGEVPPMNGYQGCWRPWTSYSGPTHRGCGTVDLSEYNWRNRVRVLDMLGMVPFHRTRIQGNWTPHIHTVLNGMGCVDPYARGQIVECQNGGDGLVGNKPDPDALLRSHLWPLARYQGRTGKLRALAGTHMRSLPTYNSDNLGTKVIGQTVNALMEVRVPAEHVGANADQIWFVTDQGEWGISSKWKAA